MKKKVAMLLTGVMAVSLMMTGCQSAKGLETENVKISVYKGVEVDKVDKPSEVTDDDVNTQIQSVLDENSTTEEVTGRAVKKGDTATIDFVGKMNGEAFDGGSSTDYPLEIGSNSFIDGFEDIMQAIPLTGTESFRRITEALTWQEKMLHLQLQ